ncbi:Pregnancy-associated plasma protein-A [compost metagenome]
MHRSITTISFLLFFATAFSQTMERLPCVDKKFSVVAHIFLDSLGNPGVSEAQILAAFDGANADFSPICISFEVCEFLYHPNFEYDIHNQDEQWDEIQVLYHQQNRINVFYVNEIIVPESICGFAGLGAIGDTGDGGVLIKKTPNCCGRRTHSHELGHYFSLEHTFEGGGTELADGSNCETAGDGICDTPADPYVHPSPTEDYVDGNCHFIFMGQDANGDYYDPLTGNIMSYYPDTCDCGFTHGQLKKMALYYLNNSGMW